MNAPPALPKFTVGEPVMYQDYTSRLQFGEVIRIEARWNGWGTDPSLTYVVTHPTYRNGRAFMREAQLYPRGSS